MGISGDGGNSWSVNVSINPRQWVMGVVWWGKWQYIWILRRPFELQYRRGE